jgi:5-methylcytosine-specific restriction endonuclease McrA
LNNLSARLIMNKRLAELGHKPIAASASYVDFATTLRNITAKHVVQVPFSNRLDAVRYIRLMASQTLITPSHCSKETYIDTDAFYESWEWKRLRYNFLKAKARCCSCCGSTPSDGARIVVDHIKPIRLFWHLRLDPKNLQILCEDCNMGKGSQDQTNWASMV